MYARRYSSHRALFARNIIMYVVRLCRYNINKNMFAIDRYSVFAVMCFRFFFANPDRLRTPDSRGRNQKSDNNI